MNTPVAYQSSLKGALQFAAAIAEAREILFDAPWARCSEPERVAAERQLEHNIASALEQGFILHDPCHPELRCIDQHSQFGLFNADNRYHVATIATPGTYVIRGRAGTSADLQIQVGDGEPGLDGSVNIKPTDQLDKLEVDERGEFELVISDTRTGPNWLSNTKGDLRAKNVLIRESFMNWDTERAGTWHIERVDSRGTPSPLPSRALVDSQYDRASRYLVGLTRGWVEFVKNKVYRLPLNVLLAPGPTGEDGLEGQRSALGRFQIDPSEAIVMKVKRSVANYQSIQVGDLWFNAHDYCRRQTSLTMDQAHRSGGEPDDDYWFVISHEDPGVPNWLDPVGASTIVLFMRWQGLADDVSLEAPEVDIVGLDRVREVTGEPCFSPEQRREQLAARQAASLQSPRQFS